MSSKLPRREFLRMAAAIPAAAAVNPARVLGQTASATPAAGHPGRLAGFKKAVKIGMVNDGETLLEKFELLKRLGFDGIELDSPNGLDPEEVIQARDKSGLPIHGVVDSRHWGKPFSHPDEAVRAEGLEALKTAIRDCRLYGGSTVLVVPAVVNKKIRYDHAWERSIAEIRKAVPLAEELGIRIAFENVWNQFLQSPLEFARYIDAFESDFVGAYFDVGNIVNYGWPEQWVHILGHRVFKIDVKEYSRGRRDNEGLWKGFQVELLEGDCDWPAVMKALRENDFQGWMTAEIPGGDANRLQAIAERMDRIIAS